MSAQALGDIARSGQRIQFFTTRKMSTQGAQLATPAYVQHVTRPSTILGTLPNSSDAMPQWIDEQDQSQQSSKMTRQETANLNKKVFELMSAPFPEGISEKQTYVTSEDKIIESEDSPNQEGNSPATSIDELSIVDTAMNNTRVTGVESKSPVLVHQGLFGFVSGRGMYLEHIPRGRDREQSSKVQTKISMPYSYIYQVHQLEPNETAQPFLTKMSKRESAHQEGTRSNNNFQKTDTSVRYLKVKENKDEMDMVLRMLARVEREYRSLQYHYRDLLTEFPLASKGVSMTLDSEFEVSKVRKIQS